MERVEIANFSINFCATTFTPSILLSKNILSFLQILLIIYLPNSEKLKISSYFILRIMVNLSDLLQVCNYMNTNNIKCSILVRLFTVQINFLSLSPHFSPWIHYIPSLTLPVLALSKPRGLHVDKSKDHFSTFDLLNL